MTSDLYFHVSYVITASNARHFVNAASDRLVLVLVDACYAFAIVLGTGGFSRKFVPIIDLKNHAAAYNPIIFFNSSVRNYNDFGLFLQLQHSTSQQH